MKTLEAKPFDQKLMPKIESWIEKIEIETGIAGHERLLLAK